MIASVTIIRHIIKNINTYINYFNFYRCSFPILRPSIDAARPARYNRSCA